MSNQPNWFINKEDLNEKNLTRGNDHADDSAGILE